MSLQMFYILDQVEFWIPLRDDQIFAVLAKKHPQETDAVFGLDEPDYVQAPEGVISRVDLLAAVEKLLAAFKEDPDLTPRRYVFDFDIIPGVPVEGDEDVWAVRLPGDETVYTLLGGIDQCHLVEFTGKFDTQATRKDALDIRNQAVLETVSHGPIRIRTTKKRSPIAKDLRQLRQFLNAHSGDMVTKRLL